MKKSTKILLIAILAILVVGLFVGLGKDKPKDDTDFGFSGYNELGYGGMTHATSPISTAISTGTTHTVMSANSARMYARIWNGTAGDYFTIQLTTSTDETSSTVPIFGTGDLSKRNGIFLAPGEAYVIGVDNLWKGQIVALASSSATSSAATLTISYIEK